MSSTQGDGDESVAHIRTTVSRQQLLKRRLYLDDDSCSESAVASQMPSRSRHSRRSIYLSDSETDQEPEQLPCQQPVGRQPDPARQRRVYETLRELKQICLQTAILKMELDMAAKMAEYLATLTDQEFHRAVADNSSTQYISKKQSPHSQRQTRRCVKYFAMGCSSAHVQTSFDHEGTKRRDLISKQIKKQKAHRIAVLAQLRDQQKVVRAVMHVNSSQSVVRD